MKVLKGFFLFLLLVVFGLGLGGCFVYGSYNKAIGLDEKVKQSWAQIESQLQRRFDLVDNLVETVKGYAAQEKDIFLGVAEARKAYFTAAQSGSVDDKVNAATGVERALSRLLVLQEKYPELKSNELFMKLQDSIEGTENRLAVERQRFNESVGDLNTFVRGMWGRIAARFAGVKEAAYFKVDEAAKAAPKVDFGA